MLRSVSRLGLARQQSSTARNWAVAAQRTVAGPSSYLPSAGSPNIQRAPDARPFSHATSVVRHAHEHGPHCNHEHVQIEPKLSLTFTCIVNECGHRSTHEFTRRSYERGIVIIQCPNCKNRHLIADHLSWFTETADEPKTVEQIVAAKGGRVRRGVQYKDGEGHETVEIMSGEEKEDEKDSDGDVRLEKQ